MMRLVVNGRAREVDAPPLARLLDVLRVSHRAIHGDERGVRGRGVRVVHRPHRRRAGERLLGRSRAMRGPRDRDHRGPRAGGRAVYAPALFRVRRRGPVQHARGICTPGMLISAEALLRANPRPSDDEVRDAIAGNLCRCTGYQRIVDAIAEAAAASASATTRRGAADEHGPPQRGAAHVSRRPGLAKTGARLDRGRCAEAMRSARPGRRSPPGSAWSCSPAARTGWWTAT